MNKNALILYMHEGKLCAALYEGGVRKSSFTAPLEEDCAGRIEKMAADAVLALCPGGCLQPLPAGIYPLTSAALADAEDGRYGRCCYDLIMRRCADAARNLQIPAYFIDAMSTDELLPLCRVRSHKKVAKYSRGFRAEHLAAIQASTGTRPEEGNYIAVYLDDFVSVGAYSRGVCLDMNDCIGAEGPMGFTSSGDVPCAQLADYFQKTDKNFNAMEEQLLHKSGLLQYLGSSDPETIQKQCENSPEAAEVLESMIYQTAKWIGSSALVLQGNINGIIIIGKGTSCPGLIAGLKKRAEKIAPIHIIPDPDLGGYLASRASLLGSFALPVREY